MYHLEGHENCTRRHALVASYLPARRATQANSIELLRQE
jgi:hypothetical protein